MFFLFLLMLKYFFVLINIMPQMVSLHHLQQSSCSFSEIIFQDIPNFIMAEINDN